MVKTKAAEIEGKDLHFFQCTTKEEAKKNGIPDGLFFYWEYEGRKIYNPGEIISMVIKGCETGNFTAANMITPDKLKTHYKKVRDAQQTMLSNSLKEQRKTYEKQAANMPQEYKDQLFSHLDHMEKTVTNKSLFPGSDGSFKPTKEQAEEMLGKELFDKVYEKCTKEEIEKIFK